MSSTPLRMTRVDCPSCGSARSKPVARGIDFEYNTSPDTFVIERCDDCGVERLNPRPIVDELGRIYPPEYAPHHFETRLSWFTRMARDWLLRGRIKPIRKLVGDRASILEVGCGEGGLLLLLSQFGPPGWKLAGNDVAESARQRLHAAGIQLHVGRFEDLTLDAGEWDLLLMKDVIEHLDNPDGIFEKARTMLRPGGYILMETPNLDGWDARLFRKRHWGGWHFPRHWTLYTPETMSAHLSRHGFEVVRIEPTLSPNFWAQSVHHWWSEIPSLKRFAGWFDARNVVPMVAFSLVDVVQIALTKRTSNMQVIARNPRPASAVAP